MDQVYDVGALWKDALEQCERVSGTRIEQLAEANDVESFLSKVNDKETIVTLFRHDDSRMDKFRSLVRQSLGPIDLLGALWPTQPKV